MNDVCVSFGAKQVLHDVTFECAEQEILGVVGPNGAGKTTLLGSIVGLVRPRGSVTWQDRELRRLPAYRAVRRGVSLVPEGRRVFPTLTVQEHLELAGRRDRRRAGARYRSNLETVRALFPILDERLRQKAGSLSGGEQQMLVIGRALMNSPSLLMLDEPSMGLAPMVVGEIYQRIVDLRDRGLTVLLAEANASRALEIFDRVIVLRNGRVVASGTPDELGGRDGVAQLYLGHGGG